MSAQLSAPRVLSLAAGEQVHFHLRRHEQVRCKQGQLELKHTVMWVGTRPLEVRQTLYAEQACRLDDGSGWISVRAGDDPAVLYVEPASGAVCKFCAMVWSRLREALTDDAGQSGDRGAGRPSHA
ncbi:MAG: hypothetical protein CGU29_10255 [Candidatus Dactylopiibacterium carminicum]|uniref:DUF2917 domain-containing protein n=1 Tax=Candidatus Dactylopiibacterium carminicum TaxID=857335 RepID=A0A272ERN0_9RHOO|nr:hypothetical protein [Candidatus Dactylopiibacterium carminicum]KAF7598852.1 hypothetical protein BGI27_10995 [Candidatus Dactylopiibacterium carminicum]PAS92768.1 MAG: hypothetical protein CGU29_10255 [Candidatus Dactylopiibacterium carminicum]PAS98869.1 MAG: hypothetical protein BSR46_11015 [Candidatus Dactylopiibacterium carminicum]